MRGTTTSLLAATALAMSLTVSARAATEALLIGEQPADRAGLTQLWTSLAQSFAFTDVRIAIAGSPHELGDRVRQFLGTPGNADDRRLVWIAGAGAATDALCPAWDEDFVRPRVPAIVVAPACIKYLVQAPSNFEPLQAADDSGPPPGAPGVLFIDTAADDDPAALAAALNAPAAADTDAAVRALIVALSCPSAKDGAAHSASVDYSPSSSAWRMAPPLCADAKAPPPGDDAAAPPADVAPASDIAKADAVATEVAAADSPPPPLPLPPPPRPDTAVIAEAMPAVPVMPVSISAAPPLPAQALAAQPLPAPAFPPASAPALPADTAALSFASPVDGRVASDFGAQLAGKPNKGVDFEAPPGTAVKAAQSGEVVYVGELPGYGNVVAIKHGSDWATVYGHAAEIGVSKGQVVEKGQDIARVDPAKNLHFEVRRRGKPVDPRPMLAAAGP